MLFLGSSAPLPQSAGEDEAPSAAVRAQAIHDQRHQILSDDEIARTVPETPDVVLAIGPVGQLQLLLAGERRGCGHGRLPLQALREVFTISRLEFYSFIDRGKKGLQAGP